MRSPLDCFLVPVKIHQTQVGLTRAGGSLFGVGREARELGVFAATHLTGKCFDRLVVAGVGSWTKIEIRVPPYGKRPNAANKRVWTDHFFVGATLHVE